MGALAIGMSSNVMAVKLVVPPPPIDPYDVQHKSNPIAFEVTEGEITATALLLPGKKGDINGLICFTSDQINLGEDCSRVTGKMREYDGYNHIELHGTGIKQEKIVQTIAMIDFPIVADASSTYMMYTTTAPITMTASGVAAAYTPVYKHGQFRTRSGVVSYQPPKQAGIVGCDVINGQVICNNP